MVEFFPNGAVPTFASRAATLKPVRTAAQDRDAQPAPPRPADAGADDEAAVREQAEIARYVELYCRVHGIERAGNAAARGGPASTDEEGEVARSVALYRRVTGCEGRDSGGRG